MSIFHPTPEKRASPGLHFSLTELIIIAGGLLAAMLVGIAASGFLPI
jgi:hypothetical protein